jgi:hypothetical protein
VIEVPEAIHGAGRVGNSLLVTMGDAWGLWVGGW